MALNFPSDTSQPYFDPISGLKYIYNSSIGAWETAIQPPAVITATAPSINIPGFLWWDETEGRLKIWYVSGGTGAWIDATPIPTAGTSTTTPVAPIAANDGDLWWNSTNGRLYVYYTDSDSSQWVDASPDPHVGSLLEAFVSQGTLPPPNPNKNDLWFDSDSGSLYIYYQDADSSQWVVANNPSSGVSYVSSVTALGALTIGGTTEDPIVSIANASTTAVGALRLATNTEATAKSLTTVALSPGVLSSTIGDYLPAASETAVGAVELATVAETTTGTDTTKAITPKALKDALPALGGMSNPVGTVITFASQTAPSGYIKCDGAAVSRTTYATLFGVIGTTHGAGNTSTTFNLPTLTHANNNVIYCIKT